SSWQRWLANLEFFLGTTNVVLTYCFFWSARNGMEFQKRYGALSWLRNSSHLKFCAILNRELINRYQPKAVIFTGVSHAELVANCYNLQHVNSVSITNNRLIEHYSDGKHPWIFTKHWSGSFGFSKEQRKRTRSYIASVLINRSNARA